MHHDPYSGTPPLGGPIMAAVGFAGYAWATACKLFFGTAAIVEAMTPMGGWSYENITQFAMFACGLAGTVWTWHASTSARNASIKANAERERKTEDALADIRVSIAGYIAKEVAELKVQQLRHHAEVIGKLARQDAAMGVGAEAPVEDCQEPCKKD